MMPLSLVWKKYKAPIVACLAFAAVFHVLPAIRASIQGEDTENVDVGSGFEAQLLAVPSPATGPMDAVAYDIDLKNAEASPLTDIRVSLPMPVGLTFNPKLNRAACSQEKRTLLCSIPPIAAEDEANLHIVLSTQAESLPCGSVFDATAFVRSAEQSWRRTDTVTTTVACD